MSDTADARAIPRIENLNRHLGVLERRREWLAKRIADPGRRTASIDFDREEAGAIKSAITALRFHRAALEDETTAVLALDELVQALEQDPASRRAQNAVVAARRLLAEIG